MGDPIREQEIPPFSEKPEYKPQWPVDDQLIQYMQEAYAFMNKPWYQKSQLHDTWYPDAFKRKYPESDFNLDIEGLRADGMIYDSDRLVFKKKSPNSTPSECLELLFSGLAIIDCGTALDVAIQYALCRLLGTLIFDAQYAQLIKQSDGYITSETPFFYTDIEKDYESQQLEEQVYSSRFPFFSNLVESSCPEKSRFFATFIEGVEGYKKKHPKGYGRGYNAICVGQNDIGEDLFMAFDDVDFCEPKTLEEIREILVKAYNKPPYDPLDIPGPFNLDRGMPNKTLPLDTKIKGYEHKIFCHTEILKSLIEALLLQQSSKLEDASLGQRSSENARSGKQ